MSIIDPHFAQNEATHPAFGTSLIGASRADLAGALRALGLAEREIRMRVSQLWHWIYFQGVTDFDRMSNVAKTLRYSLYDIL